MPEVPTLTPHKVIRVLEKRGFVLSRVGPSLSLLVLKTSSSGLDHKNEIFHNFSN
jgi:hypothetical protein